MEFQYFKIFKIACTESKFLKNNLSSRIHFSKHKIVKNTFIFFNLTIKSPEQPCWCHSAVSIGGFNHALRIAYCWLWDPSVYV